jgi:signal transduction histidine kinase
MAFSLRIKLLFSHLVVIVLAMALSGVLLLSFLERYFLEATEASLIAQARITAQALIPGAVAAGPPVETQAPSTNLLQQRSVSNIAIQTENLVLPPEEGSAMDLSYLSDASLQLGTQLETRIRVLDAAGFVLVDSWSQDAGADLRDDVLVAQALGGQYAVRTDRGGRDPAMRLALPVAVDGALAGVVCLSQPLRDVTLVLRDLRNRLLLSTVLGLGMSGLVGLVLSAAITRPLRRLTRAAGAVAQGQFDVAVPARSRDELGRLSRAFNDMTARLQAARQMQVDFVANVSHELRTPLTSIKGMVETLRAGALDDLAVRDRFLGTVEEETDRLIRLVQDLLTLSRADSEALNLRREAVNLADVARAAVRRLAPQAEAREVALDVAVDPAAPLAWADADRVAQVLLNLLDNAIKYSRPGGRVTLAVTPDVPAGVPGDVLVRVRDRGIGIPAEALPRIGERFYRADKARARAHGGSGLGLAIARALVVAHGGELWLESEEGAGTVACFTLPVA